MVLDVLDNFGKYAALNPYFSLVDAFMRTHQLEELALGTYNIKGEDVVLKIEQAMGKNPAEAILESHRQMIDIQIPLQLFCRKRHFVLSQFACAELCYMSSWELCDILPTRRTRTLHLPQCKL